MIIDRLTEIIGHNSDALEKYISLCLSVQKERPTKKFAKEKYGYIESHHIIPRSFDINFDKLKSNLVHFTAREHFRAHKLLIEATQKNIKLHAKAVKAMTAFQMDGHNQCRDMSEEEYEFLRECSSFNMKLNPIGGKGEFASFYGKKHTEETKSKLSKSKLGKSWEEQFGEETAKEMKIRRSAISKITSAVPCSDEKAKKISETKKAMGRFWITNGVEDRMLKGNDEIPEGFYRGRTNNVSKPGKENHFYGKKHSQENLEKIQKNRNKNGRYRWYTNGEETKQFVEGTQPEGWVIGSTHSKQFIGRKNTEETKQKMSESSRKAWAKRKSKES